MEDREVINNRFVEIHDSTIEFFEIFDNKPVSMGYLFRKRDKIDFNELFVLVLKWYMGAELELLTQTAGRLRKVSQWAKKFIA